MRGPEQRHHRNRHPNPSPGIRKLSEEFESVKSARITRNRLKLLSKPRSESFPICAPMCMDRRLRMKKIATITAINAGTEATRNILENSSVVESVSSRQRVRPANIRSVDQSQRRRGPSRGENQTRGRVVRPAPCRSSSRVAVLIPFPTRSVRRIASTWSTSARMPATADDRGE